MEETNRQEHSTDLHHVLVVDDEAVIREGMRRILESDSIRV